jgi:starvation-inducible DNA-binding protein
MHMNAISISQRRADASQPLIHQRSDEIQRFDQLRDMPLGLSREVRAEVAALLNKVLADTRILHDLYKKTHWLMRGHTFYPLHLLMDKHAGEQAELVDILVSDVLRTNELETWFVAEHLVNTPTMVA